jgi:hypothetical protein
VLEVYQSKEPIPKHLGLYCTNHLGLKESMTNNFGLKESNKVILNIIVSSWITLFYDSVLKSFLTKGIRAKYFWSKGICLPL